MKNRRCCAISERSDEVKESVEWNEVIIRFGEQKYMRILLISFLKLIMWWLKLWNWNCMIETVWSYMCNCCKKTVRMFVKLDSGLYAVIDLYLRGISMKFRSLTPLFLFNSGLYWLWTAPARRPNAAKCLIKFIFILCLLCLSIAILLCLFELVLIYNIRGR